MEAVALAVLLCLAPPLLVVLALAFYAGRHSRQKRRKHRRRNTVVRLQIVIFNPKGNAMGTLTLIKGAAAKAFNVVGVNAAGDVLPLPDGVAVTLAADTPANVTFTVDATGAATAVGNVVGSGTFTASATGLASDSAGYEVDADTVVTGLKIVLPA
jgi:hypothetical protein